ncbi:MAG: hypothetical protein FWC91_03965 [Defluviitaleaceae bacterium]|nr:hypothetical protein [Defluviitaleaceae bacterium]
MRILITSGGTKEAIDPVRSITNHATGRLGSIIAEQFLHNGFSVTYICSEGAALPQLNHDFLNYDLEIITICSTAQLAEKLEQLLRSTQYTCVIHAMAVSDYAPYGMDTGKKIPSDSPYLILVLKRQPKIINCIKEIQPDTLLIGFKLLSGVNEEDLLQAANKIMEQSKCDYVLANDLNNIHGDVHKAILINREGIISRGESKQEIAKMIYREVEKVNR